MLNARLEVIFFAGYAVCGTQYAVRTECKTESSIFCWLCGTWYAVRIECKTGSYIFCWLHGTSVQCLINMQHGCQVLCGFRGSYAYVISLKMKYLVATLKEQEIMLRLSHF